MNFFYYFFVFVFSVFFCMFDCGWSVTNWGSNLLLCGVLALFVVVGPCLHLLRLALSFGLS